MTYSAVHAEPRDAAVGELAQAKVGPPRAGVLGRGVSGPEDVVPGRFVSRLALCHGQKVDPAFRSLAHHLLGHLLAGGQGVSLQGGAGGKVACVVLLGLLALLAMQSG